MRAALLAAILTVAALPTAPGRCASGQAVPDRPLTLEDCTVIALSHNPQIVSSRQGVVSARAGLTRARSGYYPRLSLAATEGITSDTTAFSLDRDRADANSDTREELDLSLRMTFWERGRSESVKESTASLRASELDHTATTQGLVEQVARDYYGVLAARQLLEVAEGGVESARAHREEVKARIAVGDSAEVDIFPAEDDLARAQLDLIDARSSVRLGFAQLKNSMGMPPETRLALTESPPPSRVEIPALQEAIRTALESRPEVLASQASVRASGHALAQAKIERGPLLDVSGQYNQGYTDWQARDPSWNVLLGLSWPLFDGHATRAVETGARASLKRSQADLQRLVNQVGLDVESALVEIERASERVGASQKSVAAAEARLAAAEGKYRQGVGILIEVIDARVAVTNARANQVRTRYDHRIALVGLQRALGTLPVPDVRQ